MRFQRAQVGVIESGLVALDLLLLTNYGGLLADRVIGRW